MIFLQILTKIARIFTTTKSICDFLEAKLGLAGPFWDKAVEGAAADSQDARYWAWRVCW